MMEIVRIGKVLISPRSVIQEKLQQKSIASLVFILSLLSAIFAVISLTVFDGEYISKILGEDSTDANLLKAYKIFMLLGSGIVAFFTPVIITIINTLFNYLVLWLFRTKISFRELFIIGLYSYVPLIIDLVMRIIIQSITHKPLFQSPARIFFFLSEENGFIYRTLSYLTIFTIWSIYIYISGIYVVSPENKKKKAATIIIITNILFLLISGFFSKTV